MKKRIMSFLLALVMAMSLIIVSPAVESEAAGVSVTYKTHVQSFGWQNWVSNGTVSGTVGQSKRLEGICINVNGDANLGVRYTTHVQTYGWMSWSSDGDMSGTEGESKRLEAIKIQLTGADKDLYDIYYRVHAQSYGWLNWAKNGETAGTMGLSKRLEGIQIVVVKKGENVSDNIDGVQVSNQNAYISSGENVSEPIDADEPSVLYKTHVQSYGWQSWKSNGAIAGTYGKAKRLEGINIKLENMPYSGGITYSTHVQSYGWQSWKSNGEMSGTSGEAKRLEAIKIKLTGEVANYYDVYYRVHAQKLGWMDWTSNGDPAGTAGLSLRLEAIEIMLVPKGEDADTYLGEHTTAPGSKVSTASYQKLSYLDATGGNARLVLEALNWIGVPYVYAGNSKAGTDCSGIVYHIYKNCGYSIPRTAAAQQLCGKAVAAGQVKAGDIVEGSHTAIYIGSGFAVASPVWGYEGSGIIYVGTDMVGRRAW
jgi:uncharacterized protein YjdB